MINMPSSVTQDGDIRIHAREGARIPVFFQQDDGTPRNMVGATVAFEMEGGPRILLTAGDTTDEMILLINRNALNAALDSMKEFVVVDETAVPPNVVWSGRVMVTGFAA